MSCVLTAPGPVVATACAHHPRISSRTSLVGHEVLVVEMSDAPAPADADLLARVLSDGVSPATGSAPTARRVTVDDAFFELTLDELVMQSRREVTVVLQSTARLAGVRALATDDARLAGRELRRLHAMLCRQR